MSSDTEIISERLVSASPEQIFDAYSNPERLAHWWGPNGYTSTFHEFDFRPGGKWQFTLHGPDGTDYHNESVFTAIDKPNRIVLDHLRPMHRFQMTMTFTPEGSKTRITWRMCFESAEEVARIIEFIPAANQQNFDRLAQELANHNNAVVK